MIYWYLFGAKINVESHLIQFPIFLCLFPQETFSAYSAIDYQDQRMGICVESFIN